MKKILTAAAAFAAVALPASAQAELAPGARAPEFTTQVALAGKPSAFSLRDALRRGPVVLYFYPKAFTQGCTLEANAFAEATDEFTAAGATVIGMSNDDLATLQRFSTEHCRDKFAVGVATPEIIRRYDVEFKLSPQMAGRVGSAPGGVLSKRTSYVIAPNGRISFVHSDMDYRDHVRLTLNAVKALRRHRH